MRNSKGQFIRGSVPVNKRDKSTGKFTSKLSSEPEIVLKVEPEPILETQPAGKPSEKLKESSIIQHPHKVFRRWDDDLSGK